MGLNIQDFVPCFSSFILKITPRVPNGGGGKTPTTFKNVNFLKMRNRGQNLVYREEKIICFENLEKLRGEREIVLQNLENREEKENFNINILKIERRTRHENSFLQLERENQE